MSLGLLAIGNLVCPKQKLDWAQQISRDGVVPNHGLHLSCLCSNRGYIEENEAKYAGTEQVFTFEREIACFFSALGRSLQALHTSFLVIS